MRHESPRFARSVFAIDIRHQRLPGTAGHAAKLAQFLAATGIRLTAPNTGPTVFGAQSIWQREDVLGTQLDHTVADAASTRCSHSARVAKQLCRLVL